MLSFLLHPKLSPLAEALVHLHARHLHQLLPRSSQQQFPSVASCSPPFTSNDSCCSKGPAAPVDHCFHFVSWEAQLPRTEDLPCQRSHADSATTINCSPQLLRRSTWSTQASSLSPADSLPRRHLPSQLQRSTRSTASTENPIVDPVVLPQRHAAAPPSIVHRLCLRLLPLHVDAAAATFGQLSLTEDPCLHRSPFAAPTRPNPTTVGQSPNGAAPSLTPPAICRTSPAAQTKLLLRFQLLQQRRPSEASVEFPLSRLLLRGLSSPFGPSLQQQQPTWIFSSSPAAIEAQRAQQQIQRIGQPICFLVQPTTSDFHEPKCSQAQSWASASAAHLRENQPSESHWVHQAQAQF